MSYQQFEAKIKVIDEQMLQASLEEVETLQKEKRKLQKEMYEQLTPNDKVYIARHPLRPKGMNYIETLFPDFMELHGDRLFGDDQAIIAGIATINQMPITVIAQCKGNDLSSNLVRNFGMPHPEGYRKAIRLAKQAEKFKRPIVMLVDTPGAYPGIGAEERGQSEAIAQCLKEFSMLKTPIISVVIGEGGSGGALAMSIADRLVMLEHSIYSILSPEGFASILWKDSSRASEAAALLKLTAQDLHQQGIVDHIINEPKIGIHHDFDSVCDQLKDYISEQLMQLSKVKMNVLLDLRYRKFRKFGEEHV